MTKITSYSAILGHIIGALRQQRGLEQSDIAQALGISQPSYSRLERGHAMWTIDHLYSACEALGEPVVNVLDILNRHLANLKASGEADVIPAGRANSTKGKEEGNVGSALLAGAALGALLLLITRG